MSSAATCPDCGAPVSSSVEDYYCAELCGWSQPRESEPRPDLWMVAAEALDLCEKCGVPVGQGQCPHGPFGAPGMVGG